MERERKYYGIAVENKGLTPQYNGKYTQMAYDIDVETKNLMSDIGIVSTGESTSMMPIEYAWHGKVYTFYDPILSQINPNISEDAMIDLIKQGQFAIQQSLYVIDTTVDVALKYQLSLLVKLILNGFQEEIFEKISNEVVFNLLHVVRENITNMIRDFRPDWDNCLAIYGTLSSIEKQQLYIIIVANMTSNFFQFFCPYIQNQNIEQTQNIIGAAAQDFARYVISLLEKMTEEYQYKISDIQCGFLEAARRIQEENSKNESK